MPDSASLLLHQLLKNKKNARKEHHTIHVNQPYVSRQVFQVNCSPNKSSYILKWIKQSAGIHLQSSITEGWSYNSYCANKPNIAKAHSFLGFSKQLHGKTLTLIRKGLWTCLNLHTEWNTSQSTEISSCTGQLSSKLLKGQGNGFIEEWQNPLK